MMTFIPVFFFASMYGQIALGESATSASLLLLYFFLGSVVCAQIGGRMLDRIGARRPWCSALSLRPSGSSCGRKRNQVARRVRGGLHRHVRRRNGTDARASQHRRDQPRLPVLLREATGITQTVRNYGASVGFAILGTLLISVFRSRITSSLVAKGVPHRAAAAAATKIAELQGSNGNVTAIPPFIRATSPTQLVSFSTEWL